MGTRGLQEGRKQGQQGDRVVGANGGRREGKGLRIAAEPRGWEAGSCVEGMRVAPYVY